ncbi:MAG: serine hydrolase [Frankiales bacterium]|nr:serine hydrolase [Frankiales bacterium]
MVNPLATVGSWPVDNAAAAVVGPGGVLAATGDLGYRFRLASVTKPLAALATLVAVEEGAVLLDDAVEAGADGGQRLADVLPGVTLRHLLSHASGLAPDRRQRAAEPGSRRIYSNVGFDIIGEVVTAATEIPFADYLRDAVFAPLRMSGATLEGSPASHGWASVSDLVRLLGGLLTGLPMLDPATLAAATSVQFPGLRGVLPGFGMQPDNTWGLGFEIRGDKQPHWSSRRNSPATYGHFGRAGTMFWIDPERGLGLVALSDRDFDEWAAAAWPVLSDEVLDAFS